MVRCRRFIEIIRSDNLAASIASTGERTIASLRSIARETSAFSNVRGLGSLIAFSFETTAARDCMLKSLFDERVLALPSGTNSVRFRLPLTISEDEVDELLSRVNACVPAVLATA